MSSLINIFRPLSRRAVHKDGAESVCSTSSCRREVFPFVARAFFMAVGLLLAAAQFTLAQTSPELRDAANKFKSEPGCPVDVISAKTVLEIDAVGTPMACRIYIDYKNVSNKALAGVKFRIGYVDIEDQVRGTFHAPDGQSLQPGAVGSAKWRGDRVDPRTKSIMIRGLMARYADGTMWESEKSEGGLIKDPTQPPAPGSAGVPPAFGNAASGGVPGAAGSFGAPGSFGSGGSGGAGVAGTSPGTTTSSVDPNGAAGAPGLLPAASDPNGSQVAPAAGSDKFSDGY